MVTNIQTSSEKISIYPTGAADPKPMIIWFYKKTIENDASTFQYYKYILGSCWSELTELTELFPGRFAHNYLRGSHNSVMV